MINRKIISAALVGASLFAFSMPASAQTGDVIGTDSMPDECMDASGTFALTDANRANCEKFDSTSSILPPDDVTHGDTSTSSGSSGAPAGSN